MSASRAMRDRLARLAAARGWSPAEAGPTVELPRLARELLQRGLLTPAELAQVLAECRQPDGAQSAGKLGRYELVAELARGGGGVVYQAVDPELQRLVAIKVLRHPEQAERLQREARLAARLAHPGIIAVHELGDDYIVMDYVDGATLAERLPRLPLERRLDVLIEVAQAVAHAHGQGVIHRDLKPANVLMTPLDRPIVTDFGLARELDASTLTATGTVLGTAHYMAPEQAAGHPVDARADVWALGVMLYEALAGRRPFEGRTIGEVVTAILHQAPPPLDARAPRALRRICEQALQKRPEDRYATAEQLAAELLRWREGVEPRWRPTARTLRRAGLLGTAALIALLAWGTRGPAGRQPEARQRPSASAPGAPPSADPMRELRAAQREIDETRAMFHAPWVDIRRQLQRLEAAIDRLARHAPRHANSSQLWATLGAGWRLVGRDAKAERALLRAEKLAPHDGWVAHHLAQLYLRRGMAESMTARWRGEPESSRWAGKALPYLERSARARIWIRALDRQLAAAYQAFAEGRLERMRKLCRDGLARFGDKTQGAESLCLLLAWGQPGQPAIELLDRALALRPHFPWAYYLRGNARQQAGDQAGAIQDYSAALAINPRHLFASSSRGYLYIQQEKYRRAADDCTRAIEIDPSHWWAHINRGVAREGLGLPAAARTDYDEAIRLDPRASMGWCNRGRLRLLQGDLAAALADYDRAIELDPRGLRGYDLRAEARVKRGDRTGALADLDRAIEIAPRRADLRFRRGRLRAEAGDHARAVDDFSETLRLEPRHPDARVDRADSLSALGRRREALADYDRAISLDPRHARAWLNRGKEKGDLGDHAGALADYDRAIALDPRDPKGWFNRGVERRRHAPAIADLSRAIELEPRWALPCLHRGNRRSKLGASALAIADYSRAIELAPRDAEAWFHRGVERARTGDHQGAVADFTRAVALDQNDAKSWYNLGTERAETGDERGAIAAYDRALALDPRDAETWQGRANSRYRTDDLRGALADYGKALALDPRDAKTWHNRGLVRRDLQDLKGAIADWDRALQLAPDDASALLNRGTAHLLLRAVDPACADLARATRLDPRSADGWYNLACAKSLRSARRQSAADVAAALDALEQAIRRGFADRKLLESDADLAPLRGQPRFQALARKLAR